MAIRLAPYRIRRFFDGDEVHWFVIKFIEQNNYEILGNFECKEDAEYERNRLNSAHAMDTIGIY